MTEKEFIKELMLAIITDSIVGIGNEVHTLNDEIRTGVVRYYSDTIYNATDVLDDLDNIVDSGEYPAWIKDALLSACPTERFVSDAAEMLIDWHLNRDNDGEKVSLNISKDILQLFEDSFE